MAMHSTATPLAAGIALLLLAGTSRRVRVVESQQLRVL